MSTVLTEQLVSSPTVAALYLSRRSDLRLVRIPRYNQHAPSGQKVGETRGQALQFRNAQLVIPKDGPLVLDNGTRIEDEDEKAEIIAWLDAHPLHRDNEEGFWRIDPAAPPVSRDELKALGVLNRALDEAGLVRFIEQEKAGWGREDLLEAAQDALDGVRATLAAAPQEEEPDAKGKAK